MNEQQPAARGGRRGRHAREKTTAPARSVDYRHLRNPFPMMNLYSDDAIAGMHEAALTALEELGMKILLPEARQIYKAGGARVDEAEEMVWIGREMVEAALASAPRSVLCRAARPDRDVLLELGTLVFQPGAGAPHATDLERGRRPGTGRDFRELVKLTQHFDVLQMMPPLIEPQDVPMNLRHYFTMDSQLTLSDKLPFIFSRGTPQVLESFEMLRDFRGLSDEGFAAESHCYTIINTNSPRQIDIPMAQGLIDFARHGQMSIITPFTLMGAMAPITVEAAMTLSHAEALAAITLTQLARHGEIGRQAIRHNVPQTVLVIELAVAVKFGRNDGDEVGAVMGRAVIHRFGGEARVCPQMIRQAGEIIAGLAIEPDHFRCVLTAIGMGAVTVKIAAQRPGAGGEQCLAHQSLLLVTSRGAPGPSNSGTAPDKCQSCDHLAGCGRVPRSGIE